MALLRSAPVVLSSGTVSATTANAGVDDLDKIPRGVIQIAYSASSGTWTALVQASVDGVNFFDIARSASAIITGASGLLVIPIHDMGDGIEAQASSYSGFLAATALGNSATRPGVPWRALKVDLVNVGAGTTTYVATLYSVNEQSASQGMGS